MISGGTTMHRAAVLCREHGARTIHAAAAHGVFAPQAADAFGDGLVESVVVTDTVPDAESRGAAFASRLEVLAIAGLLAPALG
jgi:ribose-phosphate pyrophosphokinase